MSEKIFDKVKAGVVSGNEAQEIFRIAKKHFALPAVNVVNSGSVISVLEAAREVNSSVIVQFSSGGAAFYTGKGLSDEGFKASAAGAIAGAKFIHEVAGLYGIPVIVHTDHAAKNYFHGLTNYLMLVKNSIKKTGNHYFLPTCLILV